MESRSHATFEWVLETLATTVAFLSWGWRLLEILRVFNFDFRVRYSEGVFIGLRLGLYGSTPILDLHLNLVHDLVARNQPHQFLSMQWSLINPN